MFSIPDMAVAGAVALLLFGPDQLPRVARRAGKIIRDVQNTSQSFIREMERAADVAEHHPPETQELVLPAAPLYHVAPVPAPNLNHLAEVMTESASITPEPTRPEQAAHGSPSPTIGRSQAGEPAP